MSQATRIRPIHIHWDEKKCTYCLSCMVVCAERHTGMSAPSRSHVQIFVDFLGGDSTAEYCRQCKNAPCAENCPQEAICFDEQVRAWIVDEHLCTACGQCVEACPFNALKLDPITAFATKCDLCLGATRCVEICPSHALIVRG